jgi:hypothetical protein
MGIADRVAGAIRYMADGQAEAALHEICSAIEATATREAGKGGRRTYKEFVHDNLYLITKTGLGVPVLNINLHYSHPEIETDGNGLCSIQDVIYHAVRCGLYHQAKLPADLKFGAEQVFKYEDDVLVLPASLIHGFIIAVVAAPVNKGETVDGHYGFTLRGFDVPVNKVWGQRDKILALHAAMDALQNT